MRLVQASLAGFAVFSLTLDARAQDWPSFRGPCAQGVDAMELATALGFSWAASWSSS